MHVRLCFLVFLPILLLSCSADDSTSPDLELTNLVEAKTFQVFTPTGWELIEEQGIDTYVGRIQNDELTIFFDQGFLSFGNLDRVEETDETIFFQRLEINGVPAIIHKEGRAEGYFETILSVYLDDGEKQNRLYVLDSGNDHFFIELFKTHKFL